MSLDIASIINKFPIPGTLKDAQPYGSGHLHDTYRVQMEPTPGASGVPQDYILQRVNHSAFTNPPQLMENIVRITQHIEKKLLARGVPADLLKRRVLTVVSTRDGDHLYRDKNGFYWRVYHFIANAASYDIIYDSQKLYRVAYMFGEFLAQLKDLPPPPLHEGIPDFHDGQKRFAMFRQAVSDGICHRISEAKKSIDFVFRHASYFDVIPELLKKGEIPLRPTHSDTKVNNVLLDRNTGEGLCVIDLDTTMMGVSLYDFGDLARTTLCTEDEDERDLSKIKVDIQRYKIILDGFLTGAGDSLNIKEKEYLFFGAKFMTLLIGMRFLTDHLQGDTYFKIHRQNHNLDRARRQFKMLESLIHEERRIKELDAGHLHHTINEK